MRRGRLRKPEMPDYDLNDTPSHGELQKEERLARFRQERNMKLAIKKKQQQDLNYQRAQERKAHIQKQEHLKAKENVVKYRESLHKEHMGKSFTEMKAEWKAEVKAELIAESEQQATKGSSNDKEPQEESVPKEGVLTKKERQALASKKYYDKDRDKILARQRESYARRVGKENNSPPDNEEALIIKERQALARKKYYDKNSEELKEYQRKRHAEFKEKESLNPEDKKVLARKERQARSRRKSYEKNREKEKARSRAHYAANRAKELATPPPKEEILTRKERHSICDKKYYDKNRKRILAQQKEYLAEKKIKTPAEIGLETSEDSEKDKRIQELERTVKELQANKKKRGRPKNKEKKKVGFKWKFWK